jgi:orotate phosphoribosyltransferase
VRGPSIRELALGLLEAGALRFGLFRLTSGKESTYYIDLRALASYPRLFRLALRALSSRLEELPEHDALCSVPTSGLIFASALAYRLRLPLVYVRKDQREHGLGREVEGRLRRGWRVALVDDVATTGGTLLSAAKALRRAGAKPIGAVVLVDRLEGARAALKRSGLQLRAYCDILSLARVLAEEGRLSEARLRLIEQQLAQGS